MTSSTGVRAAARIAILVLGAAGRAAAQVSVDADAAAGGVQASRARGVGQALQGEVVLASGGHQIAGFDVALTFDPRVLRLRQTQVVGMAAAAYQIVNTAFGGSVQIAVVREGGAQPLSGAVLRMTFDAIASGSTVIGVDVSKISGAAGARIVLAEADAAISVRAASFTDDPAIPGVTVVRAVHLQELRTRIDQKRTARGLQPFAWATPAAGVVLAAQIAELRTALAAVYAAAGQQVPTYTDPAIVARQTPVRAAHINELRAAVVAAP